ncbi:hypothetical protein Tco_1539029 [Tanacetum coccineum]
MVSPTTSASCSGRSENVSLSKVFDLVKFFFATSGNEVLDKIPKSVVKDIDGVFKKFLWSNTVMSKGRSKVAWKVVCKPKCEGGLGIRQLEEWNDVLLAKYVGRIINNKESLWIKWVNVVKLKRKSFWDINEVKNDSCTWKALLELRNKQFITNKMFSDARIKEDCSVADMIENGSWNWHVEWLNQVPILNNIPVPLLNENNKDQIKWRKNTRKLVDFSFKNACKECDSHDHLFFQCEFSSKIWGYLRGKMNMGYMPDEWKEIIDKVAEYPCNNAIRSVLRRIILATTVYHIWKERNARIFDFDSNNLDGPISVNEKKEVMWHYGGDKSPRPDGFTFKLIKEYWDMVENFLSIWSKGLKLIASSHVDATLLLLPSYPKKSDPFDIKDFRPISLLGCQYKVIAKALANRLQKVVHLVISDVQTAYVQDFEKAFDSLDWNFLDHTMQQMGFSSKWRKWIRGVKVGDNGVDLSYFQFADDALLLGKWSHDNARNLCRILRCFNMASSLKVNFSKSKFFGIGVTPHEVSRSQHEQNMQLKAYHRKIQKRLTAWKARSLSYGGRLTLIKSVLGALDDDVVVLENSETKEEDVKEDESDHNKERYTFEDDDDDGEFDDLD